MKQVQFDESIDDRRLVKACITEGKVKAFRFPHEMRNRSIGDDEVIRKLLIEKQRILITTDWYMVEDHVEIVPSNHSGIIVLGLDDSDPRTMRTSFGRKILDQLKSELPNWSIISWRNSIVKITPSYISIYYITPDGLKRNTFLDRQGSDNWQDRLIIHLNTNACQSYLISDSENSDERDSGQSLS